MTNSTRTARKLELLLQGYIKAVNQLQRDKERLQLIVDHMSLYKPK